MVRRIVMYIREGVRTKRILRAVRQSRKLQPSGYSSLNSVVPAKSTLERDSLYGFAGNTFLFGRTTRSNCSPGYVHCLAKWACVLVLFLSSTRGREISRKYVSMYISIDLLSLTFLLFESKFEI